LYELLEMKGHAHNALFVMEVKTVLGSAKGEGSSKQKAELYAAENLLKSLKENV
jgi:dsRNA-specific ribonuclease